MTYSDQQLNAARGRLTALTAVLKDATSPLQRQRVAQMQAALDAGDGGISAYIDAYPAFADLAPS